MLQTLYSRIPAVTPQGAALFRIVFGSAAVLVFAFASENDTFTRWIWVTGALFVAGALTPLSFAAFTAAAIAWGVEYSRESGHHPVSAILVALLCLLPSRWGDAWSVDALIWRRAPAQPREYGYTVWAPGVVLGIALAAAAFSKAWIGGISWVVDGAVKYHFVTDAANAPVDWGIRFGVIPAVAVALSMGAMTVESLALPAAALGSSVVRIITGAAVAGMLLGFWLFQGVFWPGWWILLLSFAPWHLVRPADAGHYVRERVRGPRLLHAQAALLAAAFVMQCVASIGRLEQPPLISAYDMYSKSYDSPAQYPADAGTSYYLMGEMDDGTASACRIDDDDARRLAAVPRSSFASEVKRILGLGGCFNGRGSIRALAVEERRPDVDWEAGRYRGLARRFLVGPVAFSPADGA